MSWATAAGNPIVTFVAALVVGLVEAYVFPQHLAYRIKGAGLEQRDIVLQPLAIFVGEGRRSACFYAELFEPLPSALQCRFGGRYGAVSDVGDFFDCVAEDVFENDGAAL